MLSGFQKKREGDRLAQMFRTWMYILFFLVLILFSIVQTKLVHYSSLAYYPMTFISAWVVYQWLERKIEIRRWQIVMLGIISLVLIIITALVPFLLRNPGILIDRHAQSLSPYVEGVLKSDIEWGYIHYLPAVILFAGMVTALYRIFKRDYKGIIVLFASSLLFTFLSLMLFVPKVERMIQGPAIDFMMAHSGPEEHVITMGFKSFAPYFYGEWHPGEIPQRINDQWLEEVSEKQPVFVVMKADNSKKIFKKYPLLEKLYEENGYVFAVIKKTDETR